MTNELPFFLDPMNPSSDVFAGRQDDGSISITVKLTFRVPDEIGLRGEHLIDTSAGDVPPDWGPEAAAMMAVTKIVRTSPWRAGGLEPLEARVRNGSGASVIPGDQFSK